MKLKNIDIQNFRQIENKKYEFKDDINIIYGKNESGKTTLFYSIISAFFDNPKKIRKTLLESYKPWGKDVYPVIKFLLQKDNDKFYITKDFNQKKTYLNDNEVENVDKLILDLLGLNKDLFEKLSCVYQNQISSIEDNPKALEKSILDIISSNSSQGVNVLEVEDKIQKKVQNMKLGLDRVSKNIGILKKLDLEIEDLEQKILFDKKELSSYSEKIDDLSKKKKERSDIEKRFNENKSFIEKSQKAKTLVSQLKNIEEEMKSLESKLNRLNNLNKDFERVQSEYQKDLLEKMDKAQDKIINLRNSIDLRKNDLKLLEVEKGNIDNMKLKPIRTNSPIIIIVSLFLLLLTFISAFFSFYILISLFLDIVFVAFYLRFVDYNRLEKFHNPAIEGISSLQKDILDKETELNLILSEFHLTNINEFFKKRTKMLSLKEEFIKLDSTIRGLLGTDSLEIFENKLSEFSMKKRDINTELDQGLRDFMDIDKILLNRKILENEDLDLDLFSLNEDIIALESRVGDNSITEEDIENLELLLENKKEEKSFYSKRLNVLNIIVNNLSGAKDTVIKTISEDLAKLGSEWIEKITEGKYSKIDLLNNEKFTIFDRGTSKYVDSSQFLSTGLKDQIYLLSRLSILNVVLEGKSSVMFFDDPFINFDIERLTILIDLLKNFSSNNQIFIFTCHKILKDLA